VQTVGRGCMNDMIFQRRNRVAPVPRSPKSVGGENRAVNLSDFAAK